eukprot:6070903-Amphidinium_carterae.1
MNIVTAIKKRPQSWRQDVQTHAPTLCPKVCQRLTTLGKPSANDGQGTHSVSKASAEFTGTKKPSSLHIRDKLRGLLLGSPFCPLSS